MSKPNFIWNADLGSQRSVKPSVNVTKFGDGYEVRTPTGINTKPKEWEVRFTRNVDEINAILAFLEARAGVEAFTWTDVTNTTATYVARSWSVSQKMFGIYELNTTFEQVFEA